MSPTSGRFLSSGDSSPLCLIVLGPLDPTTLPRSAPRRDSSTIVLANAWITVVRSAGASRSDSATARPRLQATDYRLQWATRPAANPGVHGLHDVLVARRMQPHPIAGIWRARGCHALGSADFRRGGRHGLRFRCA